MLIDFNLYLNHPYYKKISDYFDHVELITSLNWSYDYDFNIHDLELKDRMLGEDPFIKNKEQVIDKVNSQMKYLIAQIIYVMMKKRGFDYRESKLDLNTGTNNITVSLNKYDCQKKIVNQIEKTIGDERLVFKRELSPECDYADNEDIDICDFRSVTLFEINLDNFSFEEIENKIEKYAKIKDQLILALQSM